MMFIYNYAQGSTLFDATLAGGMAYTSTGVDWASFVRDICVEYYVQEIEKTKFDGVVEIDESLFGRKVKHNRGAPLGKRIWIFGIVERATGRIKLFPVDKRDSETLLKIIVDNVELGATIYSDGWMAYSGLTAMGMMRR